ncbi:MAG: hypothetical protein ABSC89_08770 [Verrucomicrobiota bacterium]|jgi:hypothetical protein
MKKIQVILAFIFGCVFICALLVLAIFIPNPTSFQYQTFRIVIALAAAGVAAMIPGFLKLEINATADVIIRAGGALAVFVVVYFFNPAQVLGQSNSRDSTLSPQSIIDSPGSLQAGRDIIIHANTNLTARDSEAELHGVLMPANEPDPRPAPSSIPHTAVKIFLGNLLSYQTTIDAEHTVMVINGQRLVWMHRTSNGLYVSADLIRADGRIIATLRNNKWEINPNIYCEPKNDRHEISITDGEGIVFRCRYLNENAVQIEGRFLRPGFAPVLVTSNQVFVDGRPFSSASSAIVAGDNGIDFYFTTQAIP